MPGHDKDPLRREAHPRVLIVGTGAMATLFGARLVASGVPDLMLSGTWQAAIEKIAVDGMTVQDETGEWTVPAGAAPLGRAGLAVDLVLVLTKAYRTRAVAPYAAQALASGGTVLTLQNGLGNAEVLAEFVGDDQVLVGVTEVGASLLGPGRVRAGGAGDTVIGPMPPASNAAPPKSLAGAAQANTRQFLGGGNGDHAVAQTPTSAAAVAELLAAAGFETEVAADMRPYVWLKLAVNCAINPLSALLRVPNGALLTEPRAREMLERAAREVGEVALALGVEMGEDPVAAAIRVARRTSANRSSMLQDLDRGAPTEIEAISGAVLAEAHRLGIDAPANEYLLRTIRELQKAGQPRSRDTRELEFDVD